jgi:hypothetical protein
LGTVAEVLTMCCFFDKYWRGVGSYDFSLLKKLWVIGWV